MQEQPLDCESRKALADYRGKRAKEALDEALTLYESQHYNAAVNRYYYACFYAVSALLIQNNITAQTHSGVKQMFGLHFVSTKIISAQHAAFYAQLFNERISSDYDDFIDYDAESLEVISTKAKDFVATLLTLM